MNFWKLFGIEQGKGADNAAYGALFNELEQHAMGLSDDEVKLITGLSGLLGKLAYSDRNISDDELAVAKKVLTAKTSISPELFDKVLQIVKQHTLELVGLEDHLYLKLLNEISSKDEKLEILESLFALAAADSKICSAEERDLSVISKGLRLAHEEYIVIKRRYSDSLASLNTNIRKTSS